MSYEQSKDLILQLEEMTNTQVFFLASKYISGDLEVVLMRLISEVKDDKRPVTLVLQTSGGYADNGIFIIKALKAHGKKVTVAVYRNCMSTGTIMALAADKILMGKYGHLGPIDGQYSVKIPDHVSKNTISSILKRDDIPRELNPLIVGAYEEDQTYEKNVLYPIILKHCKNNETSAKNLLEFLTNRGQHSYRIFYNEAKKIGFNVKKMPSNVEDIIEKLVFLAEDEMTALRADKVLAYLDTSKLTIPNTFQTPDITDAIFQNSKACWEHKRTYIAAITNGNVNSSQARCEWQKTDF